MIAKLTKILAVLFIVLLSHPCKILAVTYYVNVNNPTPGSGGSWATAFNDLNQALAVVSSTLDQIWVAKGTYKPTTTTNRAATFLIPVGCSIYGGFNGTETGYNQANPVANPTILSGDIGIPGVPTDNSYHVVTYESSTSSIIFDGFTITGGYADAGYPGSTAPSPNNTGGGFLELSQTGEFNSPSISHCIFTSNFAVYGGGFGAYGDGGTTFFGIVYCSFRNNSAWSGGAAASLGYNANWSISSFDMCTFIDNSCLSSQGSVIAAMNTNGGASYTMLTQVYNSVFYDDPQPQLYNLTGSGSSGSLQVYTSIIWNSVAPYAGPLYAGNNVLIDMCDLDLVTPISSNLDVDPQFTNPVAGDFHIPHCSPLIDQGFTTDGFNIGKFDPDGNKRILGPNTDIGLYESQLPPYPTVSNATYCQYATASPLTATALPGNTLLWYTTWTGGTGSTTAITPSTATASPFATYYYVSQEDALGCEGGRYPISVTVKAAAAAPTASSPTYCLNVTAPPLTASGSNLLWYTSTSGGTGDPTAPTPSTASTGSATYYVTQTPTGGCESARIPVTVTIASSATAPVASSPTYCLNVTAPPLTASGSNLLWYTSATGGTGDPTAPIPSTASTGSTTYYVTQTPSGSCESTPTAITVTIKPGAAAPTGGPAAFCQNATASPLTASGSNLLWYTSATGGAGDPTAPIPSTAGTGSTTYYVTQTPTGSCESPRTAINVTVNPIPSADFTWSTPCEGQPTKVNAVSTTADQYDWDFGTVTSVTGSGAGPYKVTWPVSDNYTVTLTTKAGTCQSNGQHTITVNPAPKVGIIPPTHTPCAGTNITLEAYGASSYQWSPAIDLSNPSIYNPILTVQGNVEYTVTGTDGNGCQATAEITLNISPDCISYYIPNAFSPNRDGHNEAFRIRTGDSPRSSSLLIFNRYGGKVFESSNINNGWNGDIGGTPAPSGTYVYVFQATTSAGTIIKKQGSIILIR